MVQSVIDSQHVFFFEKLYFSIDHPALNPWYVMKCEGCEKDSLIAELMELSAISDISGVGKAQSLNCITLSNNPDDFEPLSSMTWYLDKINAPEGWIMTHGNPSQVIGVIDVGFYPDNSELINKVDFSISGSNLTAPLYITNDPNVHGLSISFLAAGDTDNNIGLASIGYNSKLALWPSYNANANDLIETSDGGLMISGQSQRHFTNEYQFRVIKTDTLGNVVWDKDLGVDGFLNGGGTISELPDGSFIYCTLYGNEDLLDSLVNPKGRIVFIDSDGNILRQQDYIFGSYTSMNQSLVINDGTFIVRGIGKNQFDEQYVNLLKFDPMGNIIWQRPYTILPDWPSIAYTLKKTDNNGLLFAGSTWVETDVSFQQRAWLVKTDCFGCDSLLCYYEDSTCLVYNCNEYPTNPQFTVSNPDFSTSTGTTFTQNQTSNTTMRYWDLGDGTTQMGAQSITHTYTQAGSYLVKLRSHHSACNDEFEQTVVVTQNIGESYANDGSGKDDEAAHVGLENWENRFRVYPNPAENELFVEFPSVQGSIRIVDLLGKEVLIDDTFNGYGLLDVSNLSAGVYVLRIRNELGTTWFKQVVLTK